MKRKRVAAMLVEPRRFELREEEVEVRPDQVWVRVEACGVCHSEMVFYLGKWQGMRFPLAMGHEHAGVIEEVGSDVRGWKVGDRVTCLPGPGFATHVATDPSQIARVPDGLEIDHALGEPLQCAARCARSAAVEFGDSVFLIGCGFMGLLTMCGLVGNGAAEIIAVDTNPHRLQLAKELGATVTLNPKEVDVVEETLRITEGRGVEVAIEATGKPEPLEIASRVLRTPRPKLVLVGWHNVPATYNLSHWANGAVVHNPHPAYSLNPEEDIRRGLWAAQKGIFPMERMVTHRFALKDIGRAFEMALSQEDGYIKGVVKPNWL